MFNINSAIETYQAAEAVYLSPNLTPDEKNTLLPMLRDTVPTIIPGIGEYAMVVVNAINRMITLDDQSDKPTESATGQSAPKQRRKAQRVQDTPEVATGSAGESPEAATGEAPEVGGSTPTEDLGRVAAADNASVAAQAQSDNEAST